jgi:hypothetical protein
MDEKTEFIELLCELSESSPGSVKSKVERMRIQELLQVCERALETSDYESFLENFSEHLSRSKQKEFDVPFKILWIRFIGQLVQEAFWNDIGVHILRKCLYLISDFKEAMNEFFGFLTRDN